VYAKPYSPACRPGSRPTRHSRCGSFCAGAYSATAAGLQALGRHGAPAIGGPGLRPRARDPHAEAACARRTDACFDSGDPPMRHGSPAAFAVLTLVLPLRLEGQDPTRADTVFSRLTQEALAANAGLASDEARARAAAA